MKGAIRSVAPDLKSSQIKKLFDQANVLPAAEITFEDFHKVINLVIWLGVRLKQRFVQSDLRQAIDSCGRKAHIVVVEWNGMSGVEWCEWSGVGGVV